MFHHPQGHAVEKKAMEKEILAWRKYPEPAGKNYDQEDLADPLIVKEL